MGFQLFCFQCRNGHFTQWRDYIGPLMVQVTHCACYNTTLARKHTVIVNAQTMHFQWVTYVSTTEQKTGKGTCIHVQNIALPKGTALEVERKQGIQGQNPTVIRLSESKCCLYCRLSQHRGLAARGSAPLPLNLITYAKFDWQELHSTVHSNWHSNIRIFGLSIRHLQVAMQSIVSLMYTLEYHRG